MHVITWISVVVLYYLIIMNFNLLSLAFIYTKPLRYLLLTVLGMHCFVLLVVCICRFLSFLWHC